jgi:Probable addiction module antidote protein
VNRKYAPFGVADYLDTAAVIAKCLTTAMRDLNQNVFLAALGDVATAHGSTATGASHTACVSFWLLCCAASSRAPTQGRRRFQYQSTC